MKRNLLARAFNGAGAPPKLRVGKLKVFGYDPDEDGDRDVPGLPDVDEDARVATMYVYDVIGGWSWDGPTTEDLVRAILNLDVDQIHVRINSPGGSVFDATAIKTAIEQHSATVHAHVDGLAASAASTLMLAGDDIDIAPGGFVMIHNPSTFAYGDATEMRASADMLDAIRDSIAAQYVSRTGLASKDVINMMAAETWLSASDAVDKKFVDRVMDKAPRGEALKRFDLTAYERTPEALLKGPALSAAPDDDRVAKWIADSMARIERAQRLYQ